MAKRPQLQLAEKNSPENRDQNLRFDFTLEDDDFEEFLRATSHRISSTNMYKLLLTTQLECEKRLTGEKEPLPGARTRGLRTSAEFQPWKPPMWPQFFVSTCDRIYGN